MPNKRFLGLGFTFTATDKGLEKKLSSVSSLLGDISGELDTVNKKFKSFESLLNNAEMPKLNATPKMKARPKARKTVEQPRRKQNPPVQRKTRMQEIVPVEVMNFKELGSISVVSSAPVQSAPRSENAGSLFLDHDLAALKTLGSESQEFFQGIMVHFKKDTQEQFKESIKELELFKDEFGDLTVESKKKLRDLAIQQGKASTYFSADFHKKLGKLDLAFTKTTEYLSDVKDSFGELAGTFGLHLKDIIPPQFMAAGKLLKTILGAPLKGLFKGAKSLITKPFTKKKGEADNATVKALRKLNVYGSKQAAGVTQSTKATKNLLVTNRKSQAFLGEVSASLSKDHALLTEILEVNTKASAKLGGASIGRGKKNIYNILADTAEKLNKPTEGEGMSLFKKIMIGATLLGVAVGIVIAKWDDIKAWFGKIGPVLKDALGSVGQWAKDMGSKAIDWVGKAFSGIGEFITKAFQDAVGSLVSSLSGLGPKLFAGMLSPVDSLSKKTGEFKDKIFDSVTGLFGKKKVEPAAPTPLSMDKPKLEGPTGNRVQDLRDNMAMKQNTDNIKNSESQLSLMQQNNSLMNQMLSTMQKAPAAGAGTVNVKIGSDARKQGFNAQQQELQAHGLAGQ